MSNSRRCAFDQQIAFKFCHCVENPHRHLASGTGQSHLSQRQVMDTYPVSRETIYSQTVHPSHGDQVDLAGKKIERADSP